MLQDIGNYTADFFIELFTNMILGLVYIARNLISLFLPAIWIYTIVLYYSIKEKKSFTTSIKFTFIYFALFILESVLK